MFRKKEKQSLLEAKTKALKNAEKKIEELTQENLAVHEENKDLRFENEEQKDLINSFIKELYSNVKTDEQKISKLKELISDYQSQN